MRDGTAAAVRGAVTTVAQPATDRKGFGKTRPEDASGTCHSPSGERFHGPSDAALPRPRRVAGGSGARCRAWTDGPSVYGTASRALVRKTACPFEGTLECVTQIT
ncbi:hypothetical protein GCM10009564_34060 [Streptomyces thermogriseus]|uniref:Uncharacterized protein n=1 Tax=Streptomyces thermogriseus TaxID=75292 RepID=A0ABP4DK26_9ACTN